MLFFRELGLRIRERWRAASCDEAAFADIAVAELAARPPAEHLDLDDVLRWVQTTDSLCPQVENEFGSPITVHRDQRFYIEVLTWIDGTTAIHEHGFSGAFSVLDGSSLHARYTFHRTRRFSERLFLGRVEPVGCELLARGDVRAILAGSALAHALFHLDRPSATVVVRTERDVAAPVQLAYTRSGLAFDPFLDDVEARRLLRTLSIMRSIDHPDLLDRALELVGRADPMRAFRIAQHLATFLPHEQLAYFFAEARASHPDLFDALAAAQGDERRDRNLIARRHTVTGAEHRFLLALLLNLRHPEDILAMVRQRFPDHPARATVMRWVRELAALPGRNGEPNPLGIELDELGLEVLELLLAGRSPEEVVVTLAERYDDVEAQRDGVLELCHAFRTSLIFAPLLEPSR